MDVLTINLLNPVTYIDSISYRFLAEVIDSSTQYGGQVDNNIDKSQFQPVYLYVYFLQID